MHSDHKVYIIVLDISLWHIQGRTEECWPEKKVLLRCQTPLLQKNIYTWSFTVSGLLGLGTLSRQNNMTWQIFHYYKYQNFIWGGKVAKSPINPRKPEDRLAHHLGGKGRRRWWGIQKSNTDKTKAHDFYFHFFHFDKACPALFTNLELLMNASDLPANHL